MKKKLLAIASLLCSGVLCAGVGALALSNENTQTVQAEGITSTWTSGGKTYTFEGNKDVHTTTDIRDLGMHDLLETNEGVTGYNVNPYNTKFAKQNCMIFDENAAWLNQTGGVKFQFKTDDYWYSPDGEDAVGGQAYGKFDTVYMNVYYGDLRIRIEYANWGKGNSKNVIARIFQDCGSAEDSAHGASARYISNFFETTADDTAPNGALGYMKDYATLEISKYKCVAIDGDASSALGYWFKLSLNGTVLYNKYIPKAMTTSTLNDFGIENTTAGRVGQEGYKITDTKWLGHTNLLTVKSTHATATATTDTEVWKDAADMTAENKQLADDMAKGFETGSYGRYYTAYNFHSAGSKDSMGVEFRAKPTQNKLQNSGVSPYSAFMGMYAGSTYCFITYSTAYQKLQLWAWNKNTGADLLKTTYVWDYDINAEYAWRITRTNVNFADASMNGKGAVIKLYMGKINPETDKPEEGWDSKPIIHIYDHTDRVGIATRRGLGFAPYALQDGGSYSGSNLYHHTMEFSSNKYVAITTNVNGKETVNRVERGEDFTLAPVAAENTIQIGWSKGAQTYTVGDFVANNTVLANVTNSATYYAKTIEMKADKAASMRFRKRGDNPLEIALKWNVVATDSGNVGAYFGNIKFGYKMTASNGASYEDYVTNFTNGFTTPYAYSVIQSNISEEYYTTRFAFQAFVEFNGQRYYTEYIDPNAQDTDGKYLGRSVDYVADCAAADVKTEKDEANGYVNAIKDENGNVICWSYLTQAEYDLVKSVSGKNS